MAGVLSGPICAGQSLLKRSKMCRLSINFKTFLHHMKFTADCQLQGDICEARRGKCCDSVATPVHQYLHVHPQANCLMTQQGNTAVDWIGKCYTCTFVHPPVNWHHI